jgi:hypothetical protein
MWHCSPSSGCFRRQPPAPPNKRLELAGARWVNIQARLTPCFRRQPPAPPNKRLELAGARWVNIQARLTPLRARGNDDRVWRT